MQFNSAAFKAKWRETCKKREIDPVEGATSFQVAAYKADVAERLRRHPYFARRWARPETVHFWREWHIMRGDIDSTEAYEVLLDAQRAVKELDYRRDGRTSVLSEELIPVDVAIREIWQELTREMRRDVVHNIPLRDLQAMPSAGVVVMV